MTLGTALKDKVAVVLGGSGGIGAATAYQFAAEGATVVVVYRSDKAAADVIVASLPGAGHLAAAATVEDTASLTALAAHVEERLGRADILVNSAGFTKPVPAGDLDALDDAFIDRMFQVNWRGQFAAIRAFRRLLEAGGGGLIVNVSSIAALNGVGSNLAYAAVKAGMDTLTKSLARALAPEIRVMSVSPGVVDTDFVPGRGAEQLAKIAPTIPLKRVATPDDVGRAIVACATHLTYSTGSLIIVDGGRAL
ncbi:SDR family NAD(P)-dependent oxidoreductase [Phreatobacter stygius]|uniref:SDR family oxidoreductase n=1 Tax=Phreatobacter stygius TaxID=1940610 RepID=A0A4D7AUL1_9HYPH|nr:SDR family oxidoreductase [Phreatobacter stygius]QCI64559.1 SDR family oxidoreductase [Phreatobacter stygius]